MNGTQLRLLIGILILLSLIVIGASALFLDRMRYIEEFPQEGRVEWGSSEEEYLASLGGSGGGGDSSLPDDAESIDNAAAAADTGADASMAGVDSAADVSTSKMGPPDPSVSGEAMAAGPEDAPAAAADAPAYADATENAYSEPGAGEDEQVAPVVDSGVEAYPPTRLYEVHYNKHVAVPYRKSATVVASIASIDRAMAMKAASAGDGAVGVGMGRFTGTVRATLTGPSDFVTITPDGPDDRKLDAGSNATWTWHLVPKVRDRIELNLRFYNLVEEDGQERNVDGEVFATTIVVDPGFWGYIKQQIEDGKDFYPFISTMIALVSLWLAWSNRKVKAEGSSQAPPAAATLAQPTGPKPVTPKTKSKRSRPKLEPPSSTGKT